MILEGIVTTRDSHGTVNVAAMGPIVGEGMRSLLLRPYQSTTTYQNLKAHPEGVFHIVDDVELLVRSALNLFDAPPAMVPTSEISGSVLADSCRWYEFRVTELDDSRERTEIQAEIVHTGSLRDFLGFNRAKHAVIEYAILASRLFMLDEADVARHYGEFRTILEKTGSPQEFRAFELVTDYVIKQWPHFRQTVTSLNS